MKVLPHFPFNFRPKTDQADSMFFLTSDLMNKISPNTKALHTNT